jgi:glucose/arabinose dehydrogenase
MTRVLLPRFLKISVFACTLALLTSLAARAAESAAKPASQQPVLTGQAAFTDAAHEFPGIRRHLTVADLPAPAPEESVDNGPTLVPRPENAWPIAPNGFKVELYATGLDNPRLIRTAPNGDLFLAESETGKIKVFRGVGPDGKAKQVSVFSTGLHQPFGIAFYPAGPHPAWIYIGNTDDIVRFPYKKGDLTARACGEFGRAARRRTAARRRALDPRRGLLEGRHKALRLCRITLQCGRHRHPSRGIPPRRRA